jgi:hypothetical protein
MKNVFIVIALLFFLSINQASTISDAKAVNTRNYLYYIDKWMAQYLYDNGITKLTFDKTNFEWTLKRWHVSLLLKRLFKDYKQSWALAWERNCDFEDIYQFAWNDQNELIEACKFGIMQGSNGKLRPNGEIIVEDLYIILARLTSNNWAISNMDDALKILAEKRLATDSDWARGVASHAIKRWEMYRHIMNVLHRVYADAKIIDLYKSGRLAYPEIE